MGLFVGILRRLLLPRWLTRRIGGGLRRVAERLTLLLLIAVAALLVLSLWRDATYTWPSRSVVLKVARTAGFETRDRDELIATLQEQGFTTLAAGMDPDEVKRVFAEADRHEAKRVVVGTGDGAAATRLRETYYFDFLSDHEYGFYLDYDTADRLVSLTWECNFFWRRPPTPLAIQAEPARPATSTSPGMP